ncbi:MAG: helicase, superfamily [Acidimicrobiales bacterium]|nr:helicase, superfamily [Acidimicrobiales bacterium]
MALHPDMEAEQAYIDHAYECLEAARTSATRLQTMVEVGRGGTEQARFEREVVFDTIVHRLTQLHLGDASLCFGRVDQEPAGTGDSYYIGRLAVADSRQEPVVVDWRAPVAEPFYRATGRSPMGLARRRHFATRGRQLLGIEDELFGEHAIDLGETAGFNGHGALISALETARSGRLGDIVATIQAEQDEIIRAPLPGVMVVQGGPGTGKTVVALHRAAYLLYTHRFPLEDQGVLVVGPNRLFLAYIEQVLPSLGEAGVDLQVLADMVDDVSIRGNDRPRVGRVKGDERMAKVVAKAVRDRERGLTSDLRVGVGLQTLTLRARTSESIVRDARRRYRIHNAGRRYVEQQVAQALADSARTPVDAGDVWSSVRRMPDVREALDRMWPVLTPAQLLHDLFGSAALLRLAGRRAFDADELAALHRPRAAHVDDVVWTQDDVPLLDEARALLGPRSRKRRDADEIRTYGHIVVDEAQDLSPMQLRMLSRRSLNGSMTVVGDIAQSTGAWAHASWDEILSHLPERRPPRREQLTVGYRIPGPNMELAARVLARSAPDLAPPRSVRQDGRPPRIVAVPSNGALGTAVAAAVADEVAAVGSGNIAVICPARLTDELGDALAAAGVPHGRAIQQGLDHQVTVVPVGLVKGLELDGTVVVEPAEILAEEAQGLRALYVALTRSS